MRYVRVDGPRVYLCAMLMLAGLPARASVTPVVSAVAPVADNVRFLDISDGTRAMQESLRRDVVRHPNDFVVFLTEAGARQFTAQHGADARRETNRNLIARGVMGYWQGKTIVVLPWEPLSKSAF